MGRRDGRKGSIDFVPLDEIPDTPLDQHQNGLILGSVAYLEM